MATNLIQTITDKDGYIIYYDADIFNQDVTLSIHLTVSQPINTTGHVQFSNSETVEWNTIYLEDYSTSGTADKLYQVVSGVPQYIYQQLSDIAVQVNMLPISTNIIGPNNTAKNTTRNYSIPTDYDINNNYTYTWYLRDENNQPVLANNSASIVGSALSRNITVQFNNNSTGFVIIECQITAASGCPRIVRKQVSVELPLSKMLIIRNRLA